MSAAARSRARVKQQWWWQLRIELLGVTPVVWRRLIVPADIPLPALHRALQASLGWTNSHLHEFVIGGVRYAEPNPEWSEDLKQIDERRVLLNKALGQSRCFDYVYDFGDDWHHVVLVENLHAQAPESSALRCPAGENACPPEDVGGAPGYTEFLSAITDPAHEEHDSYLSWVGGAFDPIRLDLAAINRALAKIKT
jgi:hypothetical protein